MKTSPLLLGALAQAVSAHYFFDTTIRNGSPDPAWRYVRDFTRQTKYNPIKFSANPPSDIRDGSFVDGPDIRCNQGAATFGSRTQVLEVAAGSEVRLRVAVGGDLFHPGPGLVYLSRAPGDDVQSYDGSGDWFKIFEEGVCNPSGNFAADAWCSFERPWIAATIPRDTPSGEYLFRAEHIGIHRSHVNQPEHYVSCAQIRVVNGGNGSPGPMVRFPGAYSVTDSYADFSVYGGHIPFTMPGPPVWTGGGGGGDGGGGDDDGGNGGGGGGGNCADLWAQCGGNGWTGPTCCSSGRCTASNEWYSQCV